MLNIGRRDSPLETSKDPTKPPLGPAPYANANPVASPNPSPGATARQTPPAVSPASAPRDAASPPSTAETVGSKLTVGPGIKLKGVEITDCDALVVEGHVEATVNSKAMQISEPGTLKGTVNIDVAEIQGEFVGELTARKRLVVHGTGRVSGTIRYGKLIVEEGGELSGDIKRLEAPEPSRVETTPVRPPFTNPVR